METVEGNPIPMTDAAATSKLAIATPVECIRIST
jgi:hypothetical protein